MTNLIHLQGAVSVSVKGINSLGGMIAFRIVLGFLEAGFFPGVSCFEPKQESTTVELAMLDQKKLTRVQVMLVLSCWYKVSSSCSIEQ